jgi:hypothetical protein
MNQAMNKTSKQTNERTINEGWSASQSTSQLRACGFALRARNQPNNALQRLGLCDSPRAAGQGAITIRYLRIRTCECAPVHLRMRAIAFLSARCY